MNAFDIDEHGKEDESDVQISFKMKDTYTDLIDFLQKKINPQSIILHLFYF
jgi:hypothetical protein